MWCRSDFGGSASRLHTVGGEPIEEHFGGHEYSFSVWNKDGSSVPWSLVFRVPYHGDPDRLDDWIIGECSVQLSGGPMDPPVATKVIPFAQVVHVAYEVLDEPSDPCEVWWIATGEEPPSPVR